MSDWFGARLTLDEAADELARRLIRLFLPDDSGQRPSHGDDHYSDDPHWRDLVLFYEYYDGDTGRGCGARHQTGWSALVASLIRDRRTWRPTRRAAPRAR